MTLEELLERLEEAYEDIRAELLGCDYGVPPELVKDMSGRYILLDALTALTNAKVALHGTA